MSSTLDKLIKTYESECKHANECAPFIEEASRQYNIPEEIIFFIIKRESHFKKESIGKFKTSSYGLMQLTESTAKWLGAADVAQLYEPRFNVSIGTKYLHYLYNSFDNIPDESERWRAVFASYNWGINNVKKAMKRAKSDKWQDWSQYAPKLTQSYVEEVWGNVESVNNYQ